MLPNTCSAQGKSLECKSLLDRCEHIGKMKFFSKVETRNALPFERLIDALKRMFVEGCEVPLRHTHTLTAEDGGQGTVLIMPAWRADHCLGAAQAINARCSNRSALRWKIWLLQRWCLRVAPSGSTWTMTL